MLFFQIFALLAVTIDPVLLPKALRRLRLNAITAHFILLETYKAIDMNLPCSIKEIVSTRNKFLIYKHTAVIDGNTERRFI